MSFMWTYDTMYKWYKKQESQTDDLVVISYDWMKVSKKMEHLEPFIKKNITHVQSCVTQMCDRKVISFYLRHCNANSANGLDLIHEQSQQGTGRYRQPENHS